jgi:hypothetical protein
MTVYQAAALLAGLAFVVVGVVLSARRDGAARPLWIAPAALAAAFAVFSLVTAAREGVTGFWPEHTRHGWGNQIWFDLLLAAGAAYALALPRLRAVGMRPLPWFLAIAASGSIGLMAMLARLFYLEARRG